MRLENKTALITGGTSGIGRSTVELFIAEGARVVFTGRRETLGHSLAGETGAHYVVADHRHAENCRQAIEQSMAILGRLDILFNNAGIVVGGTVEETSEQDWQETMDLNVTAVWRMSKLAVPIMRAQGGGVIINNASDWGLVGARQAAAYAASKGAVIQLTRSMALDHAHENIRVNALCPGDTFVQRWVEQGYFSDTGEIDPENARLSETIPMGRVAEASEIARAALFLACDDSSFMTGTTLVIDGGNTAQ